MFENIVNIGGDYAKAMGGEDLNSLEVWGLVMTKLKMCVCFCFFVCGGGDDYVVKLSVGDCSRE